MNRRTFLASSTAAGGTFAMAGRKAGAQPASPPVLRPSVPRPSVLRYVPTANLTLLDPVWSTAYVSLCHGYQVFDAPWGLDASGRAQPQMLEGHTVSDDGRTWTLRLRDGLRFHDGTPVRAADCAASFARWAARQPTGQVVGGFVDSWSAADDRTVKIALKSPLPTLALLMASSPFPPFVMPERLARTEPSVQVAEMVGSGPFRFVAGEYVSGNLVVYEKFAGYTPRPEPAEWTSGGKVARVDRIEWHIIPDAATAAAALQRGEVDWVEQPIADLLPALRSQPGLTVGAIDPTGWTGFLRFNQLQPPFDNVLVRRAVLMAVNQEDYLKVATGDDPASYQVCKAVFPCGTPYGGQAGAAAMPGSIEAGRKALAESGYKGERVVLLNPTDNPPLGAFAEIAADTMRRIGMNVDNVATDWGTVTQRRASKAPVSEGGWSVFVSYVNAPATVNPAVNFSIRGQGERGYFGWYKNDEVERLAREWLLSDNDAQRAAVAAAISAEAFRTVPIVPLGQFVPHTAYRTAVQGILKGPAVLQWNVSKAG